MFAHTFAEFDARWGENAQLAWDAFAQKATRGIPSWMAHIMDMGLLEELAGFPPGSYKQDPEQVYLTAQKKIGACCIDQYIPRNPLTMGDDGFGAGTERSATTGADAIVCDGMPIDSPEAVAEHLERFVFPDLVRQAAGIDPMDDARVAAVIEKEYAVQQEFGPNLLKAPYTFRFPGFRYGQYGYANYFMAYALFPELMEKDFKLQADVAVKTNAVIARAMVEGGLPRINRLDHDMTDSRGPLVDIKSLERIWFPEFARSIRPFLEADVRLLWHCDGNVMPMVPGLIAAGVSGFQGFQYEYGVDYEAICRMTDRGGRPLLIFAGMSVTTTLPHGTREDVKRQLKWLVEKGPPVGLVLGASSSIVPNTNRDNVRTFIEGLRYYREHGRD